MSAHPTQIRGVFGHPAASLSSAGFDHGSTLAGAVGERATAKMIDHLGTQALIIHDLVLPVKLKTNIDHLIIRDRAMLAIDSKYWAPGTYRRAFGKLRHGFTPIDEPDSMLAAVEILRRMLRGLVVNTHAIVVVHSRNNAARVTRSAAKTHPPVLGPDRAMGFIGSWLSENPGTPEAELADEVLRIFGKAGRR